MSALIQNTPEWHECRKTHIGASDAPIIMGVNPWTTPYELFMEKKGLREPRVMTKAMENGVRLEDQARHLYMTMSGIFVVPTVKFRGDYAMASLDGMNVEENHIVEIKCPYSEENHIEAKFGVVPRKYQPQLQHQMYVCDLEEANYFSFYKGKGVIVKLKRDDNYIKKMIEEEDKFWECMQTMTPPPLMSRDWEIKEDPKWLSLASEWKAISEKLKELEEKEEGLRKQLITESANKNTTGGGVKLTRVIRKGSVDYNSIPELKVIDLDQYRKPPGEYWKISL